jgi:hypothetical protein
MKILFFNKLSNIMHDINKSIKHIKPVIKIVFVISLLYSLCYQFIFLNMPELFPYANGFGIITFNLSLSFIASIIFYFIAIHIREYENKKKANSIVKNKIVRLLDIERVVTTNMILESSYESKGNVDSKEDFVNVMSKIKMKDIPPPNVFLINTKNNNWEGFLFYFINNSQIIIKEIYQFMPYLELDLLVILDQLEGCQYFEYEKYSSKITFTDNLDLSWMAGAYHKYRKLIHNLSDYLKQANHNFN